MVVSTIPAKQRLLGALGMQVRSKMASRLSSLEMVKDRSSAYRIFVAAGEPRPVHFAAEELQAYLRRATGVVLPVTHQADGPAIRLRIRPPPQDRDGFRITAGERDLFIEGANGRSVLYGVYAFLEQGCGIGFYAPNFEHVPTLPALTIPADFHYEESADFKIRSIRTEWNTTPETVAWAAKHRFNAYSLDYWIWEQGSGGPLDIPGIFAVIEDRGLMAEGSGHAMWHFLKADDYLEQHPEWFAQVNGKPVCKKNTGDNFCYSNPAAVETFADNVIAFCRRFPQIRRISLWPGDGGAVCECAQCRSRPFMEWYGDVIARVTKRLHAVFPETTVIQFSYNGVAIKDDRLSLLDIPPRQPELPTLFSFWGQDLGQSLARNPDPAHRSVFRQIQAFCRRARGKCVMFSYHTDTFMNSNLCPVFDPAVMSEEFQDFKALDIDEVFLLWITWNTESDQNMSWLGYQNGALWGRRAMTARFDGAACRRA